MRKLILVTLALAAVAACSNDRGLRDLRSNSGGPDEFTVMPLGALEIPENLNALPAPTPGAANRTDPNPTGDAIAVLGGNPARANAGGIPASDQALIARVSRNGTQPDIRQVLAAEDEQFRKRRSRGGFLGIFGGGDRYFRAYAGQALDAYAELTRFRNLGVATPTAPPVN